MARIKGIDVPNDKHISIALTYIYGIGRKLALTICEDAKVEPSKKAKDIRSFNPEESEILYPRNSQFIVKEVYEHNGKYYILWGDDNE